MDRQSPFGTPLVGNGLDTQFSEEIGRSIHTIIVDHSALFRLGLAHILGNTCFRVVANCGRLDELPDGILEFPGALLLLGSDEADAAFSNVSRAKAINPSLRVIILSDSLSPRKVLLAIQSGADAFLAKNEIGLQLFLKSLEVALLGASVIPQGLALPLLDGGDNAVAKNGHNAEDRGEITSTGPDDDAPLSVQRSTADPVLSSREQVVLKCLMQGASNKVIARDIGIAEATVKVHVKSLLRKIRVKNRTQAAMWAINHLPERSEQAEEVLRYSPEIVQEEQL